MTRFRPTLRTHVRPMRGWWRGNPYFVRYMIREGSALFVTGYALVLLAGLYALSRGPAAYEAWRAALGSPVSLLFHVAALLLVGYHSVTWFGVMPKTAPRLPFPARLLTLGGWAATLVVSVLIIAVLAWAV